MVPPAVSARIYDLMFQGRGGREEGGGGEGGREEEGRGREGGRGRGREEAGGGGEGDDLTEHMDVFPSPLICSSMMGCEVLYSTHAEGLGPTEWSSMGEPSSCFMVTVLRSLTVEKSTLAARPAMAEGDRFFFAACANKPSHSAQN